MPKLRYALIKALNEKGLQTASALAIAIHHPTQTTKRALEDLAGLKLIEREKIAGLRGDHWSLTEETRIRLQQLPENIENDDVNER
jgi:DNA-binding MarR family transcriptional regulator